MSTLSVIRRTRWPYCETYPQIHWSHVFAENLKKNWNVSTHVLRTFDPFCLNIEVTNCRNALLTAYTVCPPVGTQGLS
jgi:hypothetical protein